MKTRIKVHETNEDHHGYIEGIEKLDLETYPLKNEERMKNGGKPSRICLRKHLESVTEAPRLGFSSRKQFFPPKTAEIHHQGDPGSLEQPPSFKKSF